MIDILFKGKNWNKKAEMFTKKTNLNIFYHFQENPREFNSILGH